MNCLLGLALSLHLNMDDGYNMIHPYVTCERGDYNYGLLVNSEKKISNYLSWDLNEKVELGFMTGYSSGYVVPMARFKAGNLFAMPGIEDHKLKGIVVGIEIPLGER